MRRVAYAALVVSWLVPTSARAASSTPLAEMSLEDLLDVEVAAASLHSEPARRSPGIVTVLTRDELVASGARDLIDALGLVPGLSFSLDVVGVVGVSVRGNWAHEGKILVLVDGIPWNETQYGTVGFGNRFPVALIERIEVIRGPGSVVHGGYAELGVINIVTVAAAGHGALTVDATYGQMAGAGGSGAFVDRFARRTLAVAGGIQLGDDARVFGRAVLGEGQRGVGIYTDLSGGSYDLQGNADLDPWNGAVGLTWRGLSAQLAFERYRLTYRDGYDTVWDGPEPIELHFSTVAGEVSYRAPVGARHVVTPYLRVLHQLPWSYPQDFVVGTFFYFGTTSTRATAGVTVASELTERLSLVVGAEGYLERSVVSPASPPEQRFDGASQIDYLDGTVFAESTLHTPDVDLTAGARAEVHSVTGLTVVPRLAATTTRGGFHAKALLAQGFRAPSVQNVRLAPDIRSERTTSLELEVGQQLGEHVSVSANIFDITISDTIVYGYDPATMLDGYVNGGRTGSRGVEAVARVRAARLDGTLGYAFYDASKNQVEAYQVPGSARRLLGAPSHELTLHGRAQVTSSVSVSPSVIVRGDRYGQVGADADGAPVVARFDPSLLLTLVATVADVGTRGLDLSLGVHDLLDQRPPFLQAYAGGHAPYPGLGREVVVRLIYER